MRRTIRSLAVGLGMTVMLGAPVSAGTSDSRYFERAHVASASNETCRASADPDFLTCEDIYVKVYSGRSGGTEPGSRFAGYTLSVHSPPASRTVMPCA